MNTVALPGARWVLRQVIPRLCLKTWTWEASSETVILLSSVFFALACNGLFWREALATDPGDVFFALSLLLILTGVHALLLGLVVWRWNAKWLLLLLFATTAFAVHYMDSFKVYLDADMLRNVLATDVREARELITPAMVLPLLVYAVLPGVLLWRLRIRPRRAGHALLWRLLFLFGSSLAIGIGLALSFQEMASLLRNHREIRYLATPINYLVALKQNVIISNPVIRAAKTPIGTDARMVPPAVNRKPRLLVLVVGETARAQNWGLNGYSRQTTPQLAGLDVINFPDVSACGTSTEVSLPCMFSPQGRRNYDEKQIRSQQSLLHVLEYAGIRTVWRDNQSGCKGVCDGLRAQSLVDAGVPDICNDGRCLDEILLHALPAEIRAHPGDQVIVLHQLGNHGPAYYLRHPPGFRQFTPTCDTVDLGKCTRDEIINSYDNALLYTDAVLAQTITLLRGIDEYDTALIYLSDHGESLGEKGLYLHGMPYAIAPQEQLKVPMVMWFSPSFAASRALDLSCLRQRARTGASHDHLFSSILGLMQVNTAVYDPEHDLFGGCAAQWRDEDSNPLR